MTLVPGHAPVEVRRTSAGLSVSGDLASDNAAAFEASLSAAVQAQSESLRLDLADLHIDDGLAVVFAVNALRKLRTRSRRLILVHAPQILAHNLYRVGMLEGEGAIELVDMREDEPYG